VHGFVQCNLGVILPSDSVQSTLFSTIHLKFSDLCWVSHYLCCIIQCILPILKVYMQGLNNRQTWRNLRFRDSKHSSGNGWDFCWLSKAFDVEFEISKLLSYILLKNWRNCNVSTQQRIWVNGSINFSCKFIVLLVIVFWCLMHFIACSLYILYEMWNMTSNLTRCWIYELN